MFISLDEISKLHQVHAQHVTRHIIEPVMTDRLQTNKSAVVGQMTRVR